MGEIHFQQILELQEKLVNSIIGVHAFILAMVGIFVYLLYNKK